jgi:hypothetical protein
VVDFTPWIRYKLVKLVRYIEETDDTGEAQCFAHFAGIDEDSISHDLKLEYKCYDEERFPLGLEVQLVQVHEPPKVDRAAWHRMMAGAYGCMDEIEMVVGSEKCDECGEWHPIPKHWPKKDG